MQKRDIADAERFAIIDQNLAEVSMLLAKKGIIFQQREGYKAGKAGTRRNWCQLVDGDIRLNTRFPNQQGQIKTWKIFARFPCQGPPGELWDRPERYERKKAQWMPAGPDVWGIAYEDILNINKRLEWKHILELIVSDLEKSRLYFRNTE